MTCLALLDGGRVDSLVAYVKQLVASVSETDPPADMSKFDRPSTSETKDPISTQ